MPPRNRTDPNAAARTAVAQRAGNGGVVKPGEVLRDRILRLEGDFQMAMPRGLEAKQLVRDALTCLRTTPKLMECYPDTVLGGLMTCAQLGLRPGVGGLGHAWLIPFKGQAQLVIGYQGYAELAHRTGQVSSLIARPVHANDDFEVDYGLADSLVHRPLIFGDRGDVIGYYAIVKFRSGGHAFDVMSRSDVEGHRDRFAMARNREGQIVGPWVDHFDSMALKTVFKRLMKWAPKSPELVSALAADETVRDDVALDAMPVMRDDVIDGEAVEDTPALGGEAAVADDTAGPSAEDIAAMNAEAGQ